MNAIQVPDVETPPRIMPRTKAPYALQLVRPRYKMRPRAIYKPESRWTVIAAFILAVVLCIGAVAIIEMNQQQAPVKVVQHLEGNARPAALD